MVQEGKIPGFDFSTFFADSPGLSILRPRVISNSSNNDKRRKEEEEEEYWKGMSFQADDMDSFLERINSGEDQYVYEDSLSDKEKEEEEEIILDQHSSFKTPMRKKSVLNRFESRTVEGKGGERVGGLANTGTSIRSKRMISDLEAWKEMQELAFEVGRTAKKKSASSTSNLKQRVKQREKEEELEGIEGIQVRRLELLIELEGIEEKLEGLRRLVRKK